MKKNVAFTIVAKNYLHYAITLWQSISLNSSETGFRIYVADGSTDDINQFGRKNSIPIYDLLELSCVDKFMKMAFYYEVTEYCTSVKPFIFDTLIGDGYEHITYIDPDIYIYRSLSDTVYDKLKNYNLLLTPHICNPIDDNCIPNEVDHLFSGTYNLGFISLKNTAESRKFIKWWCLKCETSCFNDPSKGLFVDQKWINLVPGMFDGVNISRDSGLNMAYWNLHERKLGDNLLVNGKDILVFFHFSGIDVLNIDKISKYQNRYTLYTRPDLKMLFEDYAGRVINNKNSIFGSTYTFNNYLSGKCISLLARRVYYWNHEKLNSPFKSIQDENKFIKTLSEYNIKESNSKTTKPKSIHVNRNARVINFALRQVLKCVGPERYGQLIKYFHYLSSINNHRFIEKDIDVV